jgi:hypothetical protein
LQNAVHDREQQLIAAHRRETALSGETAELERQNAEAFRQFEARAANVKRQMTHAEHAVRAHELTIEKLQQRLQRAVAKEERKREHDKEVFERLTGRAHKPLSSKDQVCSVVGDEDGRWRWLSVCFRGFPMCATGHGSHCTIEFNWVYIFAA